VSVLNSWAHSFFVFSVFFLFWGEGGLDGETSAILMNRTSKKIRIAQQEPVSFSSLENIAHLIHNCVEPSCTHPALEKLINPKKTVKSLSTSKA